MNKRFYVLIAESPISYTGGTNVQEFITEEMRIAPDKSLNFNAGGKRDWNGVKLQVGVNLTVTNSNPASTDTKLEDGVEVRKYMGDSARNALIARYLGATQAAVVAEPKPAPAPAPAKSAVVTPTASGSDDTQAKMFALLQNIAARQDALESRFTQA